MSSKKWKCFEIHTNSLEQRNNLICDVVRLMRQLEEESHLESYFFNRYANSKKNVYFVKLGIVNSDKKTQSELNDLLKKHSVLKDVEPYDCEMWKVDGVTIDEIKCISCALFEKVKDSFEEGITIKQAFYLLHFLMNQLGYSYEEEYELYKVLERRVGQML